VFATESLCKTNEPRKRIDYEKDPLQSMSVLVQY